MKIKLINEKLRKISFNVRTNPNSAFLYGRFYISADALANKLKQLTKSKIIYNVVRSNKQSTVLKTSSWYQTLMNDIHIVNYFKRYYPLQKLENLECYLKRSKYYDSKFMKSIEKQIANTRATFIERSTLAVDVMSKDFTPSISEAENRVAMTYIIQHVFEQAIRFVPSADFVFHQINKDASSGLPEPWKKKKALKNRIKEVIQLVLNRDFKFEDCVDFVPLTAAFSRNQITHAGLKTRLVFAVNYVCIAVETFFNISIKKSLSDKICCHGLTQLEISHRASSCRSFHTLCVDYSSYDYNISRFVLCAVQLVLNELFDFDSYFVRLFNKSFDLSMTMQTFHPEIALKPRNRGLSSGSGYTSIIGSLCNTYMLIVCIYRYCKQNRIKFSFSEFFLLVSSDDTVIASTFRIDFTRFAKIMYDAFGMTLTLESSTKPSEDRVFFLGSEWVNGSPYRDKNRMFARILFGSGNYPKMSNEELFASRCFEILGNSADFGEYYRTFGVTLPTRVFRALEIADYQGQIDIRARMTGEERRGVWVDVDLTYQALGEVWKTR